MVNKQKEPEKILTIDCTEKISKHTIDVAMGCNFKTVLIIGTDIDIVLNVFSKSVAKVGVDNVFIIEDYNLLDEDSKIALIKTKYSLSVEEFETDKPKFQKKRVTKAIPKFDNKKRSISPRKK